MDIVNYEGNDIIAYRIIKRFEPDLLNDEVIDNNMYEANNHHNTEFIMSISTSWFRAHPGSTMLDLDNKMEELGISTLIIPMAFEDDSVELCIPGNPDIVPKYIATFVNDFRDQKERYLRECYDRTVEENTELLKQTGYPCSRGQRLEIANAKPPTLDILRNSDKIMQQLQWGCVSITVEQIDSEIILKQELDKIREKYGREPYRYRDTIEGLVIDFFILPEDGQINILSQFGVLHRNGKEIAIHVKYYIKSLFRDKEDSEEATRIAMFKVISKFDVNKIIDITEEERRSIIEKLQQDIAAGKVKKIPESCKKYLDIIAAQEKETEVEADTESETSAESDRVIKLMPINNKKIKAEIKERGK